MEGESMSRGGMDYSEFEELAKNFKQLTKDYNKFLGDFLMKEGNKCFADTVSNTPNVTGRLIGGWRLSGPFKRGDSRYVVIHNNVKYAKWVEDGHRIVKPSGEDTGRWQPGKHMARKALINTELNLDKNFNKEFKNFCKTRGIGK